MSQKSRWVFTRWFHSPKQFESGLNARQANRPGGCLRLLQRITGETDKFRTSAKKEIPKLKTKSESKCLLYLYDPNKWIYQFNPFLRPESKKYKPKI